MTIKSSWFAPLSALGVLGSFAPFNLAPLIFIALTPLLLRLADPDVRPFRCGYGFGLVYGFGQFIWVAQLTYQWTQNNLVLALVPLIIATSMYAVYFGFAGWLIHRCWRLQIPWMIPIVWVGVEVFRSYIPVLAFPWGLLASPIWRYPWLIQSGHFLTIFGVSGLAVLVNTALACRLRGSARPRVMIAVAALLIAVSLAISIIPVPTRMVRMTAGQPGIDLAFGDPHTREYAVQFNVEKLEDQALNDKSQLLILPEGLAHSPASLPPHLPFGIRSGIPVVFGAQRGDGPAYQSAYGYDGHWSVADKTRLVIFGEFVPRWIPFLGSFNLPTGDLSTGSQVTSLHVNHLTVGPLLCFEELFPDLALRQTMNGSQVLAVMSMDDWFMKSNAPDQLRAGAIWRAVETGRPVVRAATTGYSYIADGHGNVLGESPLAKNAALTLDVPVTDSGPPWWLPVFPLLSLTGCGLMCLQPIASKIWATKWRAA